MTIKQGNETKVSPEPLVWTIKRFYITEFNKSYSLGTIISNDEMELIYFTNGKNGSTAIDIFHRINA
ncbi:MAG: hypothetical protein ABR985_03405 [Methanotrichaceae archaeon]|jgi:hypothetical protein